MSLDGFKAFGATGLPHLKSPVPRSRVQKLLFRVHAQARNSVAVLNPQRRPVAFHLDVVAGLNRSLKNVEKRRKCPGAFMDGRILGINLPNPNFPVLVSGENLVPGDYNGLHKSTVGFERPELLHLLPNTYILAVGAGVQNPIPSRQRIDVALFADEGANEAVLGEFLGTINVVVFPGSAFERDALVPRRHHHRRALAAEAVGFEAGVAAVSGIEVLVGGG